MSDIPQSPEAIAYQLMETIFKCEGKLLHIPHGTHGPIATRTEILDAYKECIAAVKTP